MSEIEIQHDVDIPKPTRAGNTKYAWAKMNVGDAFMVSLDGKEKKKVVSNLKASANRYSKIKATGTKFHVWVDRDGVWAGRTA